MTPPGCSAGCSTRSSSGATRRRPSRTSPRTPGCPVYNGLTDDWHPTQMLADVLTVTEHTDKPLGEVVFAYLGDARFNMGNSYLVTGALLGMDVRIVAPRAYWPAEEIVAQAREAAEVSGARITLTEDVEEGVAGADFVATDVWVSMGEPKEVWAERIKALAPYAVTMDVLRATGNPARQVPALPARLPRPRHPGRPRDLRAVRTDRAGSHRRGLRVGALGRLRRGGEPDAHHQGGHGRHAGRRGASANAPIGWPAR